MPRRYMIVLASLLGFMGWMAFGTSMLKKADVQLPDIPGKPSYVPKDAVYTMIGQVWIDVQEDPIGEPDHFYITVYESDTIAVNLRKPMLENPEIQGEGRFVLETGSASVSQIRRAVKFYDGTDVYLKDGRMLHQDYN